MLDRKTASRFASLTLGHLTRQWPYRLDLPLSGPVDLALPRSIHPIFHGSYDWHSCVHGWWQVMRLARLHPAIVEAGAIEALADRMLVPARVEGELAHLERAVRSGFERPYGWGWLLSLHSELAMRPDRPWAEVLRPLALFFAERFGEYLPKLGYPVRHGVHSNTAFALIQVWEWGRRNDPALAALCKSRACDWFMQDVDVRPLEPSGEDFLSPTLCEAALMARVLPKAEFVRWFDAFLPDPWGEAIIALRDPAVVGDRHDVRLAHLDGLNLSRAWCWRGIGAALGDDRPWQSLAGAHLDASLKHVADDYMGEHWLATFALLALSP